MDKLSNLNSQYPGNVMNSEFMPPPVPPISILGIQVHAVTVVQLHDYIRTVINAKKKGLILNVNVHGLNLAYAQPWMYDFLNNGSLVFCDGAGVRLAGKILRTYIPPRITYADWMWQFSAFAQENDFSFFFLGGKPGVADKAAATLQDHFPNLRIVGVHHGYFNKSAGGTENNRILQQINNTKPNILVVGFGMPLQEKWLMANWDYVDANIALTGGAVFDYISGELQRAPKWMTDNGLEWLGRLMIEPRRLWRRYIIGNPLFFWRVMKQKFGLLNIE